MTSPPRQSSSLRSRGRASPPKPTTKDSVATKRDGSPPSLRQGSTIQQAVQFNPASYRVRLTRARDFLAVVRERYMDWIARLASIVLLTQIAVHVYGSRPSAAVTTSNDDVISDFSRMPVGDACQAMLETATWMGPSLLIMVGALFLRRRRSVYLLEFALFEPPAEWRLTREEIMATMKHVGEEVGSYTPQDLEFMSKVLANSGTGEATAWPPGLSLCKDGAVPSATRMEQVRQEAETVITQCLSSLFEKTGIKPREVDFLVINCSLFSPTPSLCAMASNRFGMRSNMRTYNLSGQGCSASLLSVDLASELLQSNPNSIAVVVSTECITQALYHGHEKGMLLQNTLFRSGGAAIMLTNKPSLVGRARYRLRHLVRTQCTDDESYNAVFECEDAEGCSGVRLSKDIVKVAGNAMKINLTQLGPLILPLSEQVKVLVSMVRRKLGSKGHVAYVPSFKTAIHHFCIHAGGRAVLDGIEKSLRLSSDDLLPSRSVLHSQGNTSSSSIWYELRHVEQHKNLRPGHKVLQLAFGSGFKCNSAVWTRIR